MTTAGEDGSWQDPLDVRRARHAPGLLRPFNDAGVLGVADVQVAVGLGRLVAESDERVLLAAALAVRALRLGSVCVDLAQVRHTVTVDLAEPTDVQALPWPEVTGWLQACAASAAVAVARTPSLRTPSLPTPSLPTPAPARRPAGDPTARPLRLAGARLYLDRYFREEESVAIDVLERSCRPGPARRRAAPCGPGSRGCSRGPGRTGSASPQRWRHCAG